MTTVTQLNGMSQCPRDISQFNGRALDVEHSASAVHVRRRLRVPISVRLGDPNDSVSFVIL